ncbi:4-hydroxy-tetrahydrodipicolinate synthase [Tamaricihabitans halophyticus]|uniref:4-hydroxy-tetrahydrodipicolinate synthase n=1 Tax=Tamaricihabitans halophyticus TaxID=1262583 RepID=A0A4R2R3Q0_9PSEU|nr:dihydrodipicolinate synthase family protein [Tamaricihabitans halophyticus]TCP54005.1 4-hydroxy-tetrahydrodipicolinate synthase [Tamaricihabitans halophyticus]
MHAATKALIDKLRHGLVPAALTPMDSHGQVDVHALEEYAIALTGAGIAGVAVWAHTGRGLYLTEADRLRVLDTFRQASKRPVIAGAGVPVGATDSYELATLRMAERAAAHGADALMVYPPAALRDVPQREADLLKLHCRVAELGLPIIGFYLHDAAGGYEYPQSLVDELLTIPELAGIKVATLDRAIGSQDTLQRIRAVSDRLAITGEDRMFGPSLMWGGDCALVGIAAARVELSRALLEYWFAGDYPAFHAASTRLDEFAARTFRAPIEGYVQLMFDAAVQDGLIPEQAAHDPYGPLPVGALSL